MFFSLCHSVVISVDCMEHSRSESDFEVQLCGHVHRRTNKGLLPRPMRTLECLPCQQANRHRFGVQVTFAVQKLPPGFVPVPFAFTWPRGYGVWQNAHSASGGITFGGLIHFRAGG